MTERPQRQVRVLTCAYRGDLDRKLINEFAEITLRNKVNGLVIIAEKELPEITKLALSEGIPVSRYDSTEAFCKSYRKSKKNYVVCIADSLGRAEAVLKGLPLTVATQLDTSYISYKKNA